MSIDLTSLQVVEKDLGQVYIGKIIIRGQFVVGFGSILG